MTEKKLQEIRDYVYSFYGTDCDLYEDFFDNKLTQELLNDHLDNYIEVYPKFAKFWHGEENENWLDNGFDSTDREIFRDYLLVKIMNKALTELEYQNEITKFLEIEKPIERGKKIENIKSKIDEKGK